MNKILFLFVLAGLACVSFAQDTVRYPDHWYGYTPREALMEYTGPDTVDRGWFSENHSVGGGTPNRIKSCNPNPLYRPDYRFFLMRFVDPGVNQKIYGVAITMYPADFDTLDGRILIYRGVDTILDTANTGTWNVYYGHVDSVISIPLRNPPLMKECVFEYDYSLPTVWSLYSNCYEFYFDEPMDLLPNYDTYIGFSECGFDFSKLTLARDTSRSQIWYDGSGVPDTFWHNGVLYESGEYPFTFIKNKLHILQEGKYVDYYTVPGYEDAYWYDCYWGMMFPILSPRCTAPKCFKIEYSEEKLDTVRWCGDPESEVFQLSLTGYPASPDSGTIVTVHDTSYVLPREQPDTICVAYVRKMCTFEFDTHTDTVWGDWAGPVLVVGDTTGLGGEPGGDTVGIATVKHPGISLTPNPTSGKVTVGCNTGIRQVTVFNAAGKLVHTSDATSKTMTTIDTQGWPAGQYVVTVETAAGTVSKVLTVAR